MPNLPRWAWGAILIALGIGGFFLWLALHDRAVVKQHEVRREAKAQPAREESAEQAEKDAKVLSKQEEKYHEAIKAAPGGELSPAARALACERLRRYGRIPPACRPASGDGNEADPD